MNLSLNTQATLLLTGYFNSLPPTYKPLTVAEWSRFADYLKCNDLQPSRLLEIDYQPLLEKFVDRTINPERISALLKRGTAMALALEKWSRANIWVISRADKEYPRRLKDQLGRNSPPIIYGCGNKAILNLGGIGVVGSRNVLDLDLDYTRQLAQKAASSGFSIISGGAKGVDQTAMLAALEAEGTVIGVMADSLFKSCSSQKYRKHIMDNNLVLITPFYPEASFNVGNAMQRNKYIYCLSGASVVVHSGKPEGSKNGGGTWTGALENLKHGWVPLWVKATKDNKAGNALIVQEGGYWLSADIQEVVIDQLLQAPNHQTPPVTEDLFSVIEIESKTDPVSETYTKAELWVNEPVITPKEKSEVAESFYMPETFYQYFLVAVKPFLIEAKTAEELAERFEVNKTQMNIWLKKAVEEKKLTKLNKPTCYQWRSGIKQQGSLL